MYTFEFNLGASISTWAESQQTCTWQCGHVWMRRHEAVPPGTAWQPLHHWNHNLMAWQGWTKELFPWPLSPLTVQPFPWTAPCAVLKSHLSEEFLRTRCLGWLETLLFADQVSNEEPHCTRICTRGAMGQPHQTGSWCSHQAEGLQLEGTHWLCDGAHPEQGHPAPPRPWTRLWGWNPPELCQGICGNRGLGMQMQERIKYSYFWGTDVKDPVLAFGPMCQRHTEGKGIWANLHK